MGLKGEWGRVMMVFYLFGILMMLIVVMYRLVQHVGGSKTNEDEQGPLSGLLKRLGYQERQVFKF